MHVQIEDTTTAGGRTFFSLSSHQFNRPKTIAHAHAPLGGGDVLVDLGGRQELVHDVTFEDLQRLGLDFFVCVFLCGRRGRGVGTGVGGRLSHVCMRKRERVHQSYIYTQLHTQAGALPTLTHTATHIPKTHPDLGVEDLAVQHAARDDDALDRHHQDQGRTQRAQGVGDRVPHGVLVRDGLEEVPVDALARGDGQGVGEGLDVLWVFGRGGVCVSWRRGCVLLLLVRSRGAFVHTPHHVMPCLLTYSSRLTSLLTHVPCRCRCP